MSGAAPRPPAAASTPGGTGAAPTGEQYMADVNDYLKSKGQAPALQAEGPRSILFRPLQWVSEAVGSSTLMGLSDLQLGLMDREADGSRIVRWRLQQAAELDMQFVGDLQTGAPEHLLPSE